MSARKKRPARARPRTREAATRGIREEMRAEFGQDFLSLATRVELLRKEIQAATGGYEVDRETGALRPRQPLATVSPTSDAQYTDAVPGAEVRAHSADKATLPMAGNDPWLHRSAGMRCRTCMFYVPKVGSEYDKHPEIGRCRRHAPTMGGYPAVFPTDWCGDHKVDEAKL